MMLIGAAASAMTWSLAQLIEGRQAEQYSLHRRYINTSLARAQAIISFDKVYTRGQGAYLWDADGHRYLDLLSGYGVFNLGRAHPVLKQVIQELAALDLPSLVKMDCPLLAGLLAENLAKRMPPGLDAVFLTTPAQTRSIPRSSSHARQHDVHACCTWTTRFTG
jgi:4-aminobutyrate aminotransferase-like enzyme